MLERVLPAGLVQSIGSKTHDLSAPGEDHADDQNAVLECALSKSSVVVTTSELEASADEITGDLTYIKSSPYDDPLNYLNLSGLDVQVKLFALALRRFDALRPDYATSPYIETFNFDAIFEHLRGLCDGAGIQWERQDFYVVIFRSQLRKQADRGRLGELDQMSHQEACASGGLLHYWFGSPDSEMRNLATCEEC
jgi:hypothetical protein